MTDTFGSHSTLRVGKESYRIARLPALEERGLRVARLPYALKILLENLLRLEDGAVVTADDVEALARWQAKAAPSREIAFMPARVLLQDFTGVPAVVDLAAMRDAMAALGGDPRKINPLLPAELVIDHSVQVDAFGSEDAQRINLQKEFERNGERYTFLRWGQKAFDNFRVVPPSTGIVHQVNLEFLAQVVTHANGFAYPDTLVGTDSHTTMINGLGVLGWGVGGIEAEAAMLGQPVSMLIPQVVGFRLTGELSEGVTATDLVLRVVQALRAKGVVGKFVEFFGPGVAGLPLADRATIANMAPEYGATCGLFPVDQETLRYLELSGRPRERIRLVEAYMKEQGLFALPGAPDAEYSDTLELDLASVEPCLAGPRRPQDRIVLSDMKKVFAQSLPDLRKGKGGGAEPRAVRVLQDGREYLLRDGSVVIAAITSCTNTSNPSVMLAAGLLARNAVARGLSVPPWVKTSLGPGSKVVCDYLDAAGLSVPLNQLGFNVVGFGCTTCIGNSGPLPEAVAGAIHEGGLVAAAVLSGNRNFEGRVSPDARANYLASPPLVVAFALAGRADIDLASEPLGSGRDGRPVFLREIWPSQREVADVVGRVVRREMFERSYADVFQGPEEWRKLPTPAGDRYAWDPASTYVKHPPYFADMRREPRACADIRGARVLALFGDSVTTDHISPAGSIAKDSPAARYLTGKGVPREDFNSYGSRRGNHEVMMRGTFANVRIRNQLVPGVEGGHTVHLPDGAQMTMYDAAMRYQDENVPLLVIAGKEYGTGSSRDWAAKGPNLLGVQAVLVESFERIHRSNLVGMGILPLQFMDGQSARSLGLSGRETYDILGLAAGVANGFQDARQVQVRALADGGGPAVEFRALVRIDTPQEVHYYRHGGILRYVLRRLL
ncbi:MAG: aconitate hydratase AcnA [Planctomycetes bacterium]|nr:aconitate hydratase AcnA [Planctomycetota bacterium]